MENTRELTLKFYNNTVTLIYDDLLHAYYVEELGQRYYVPSATGICAMIDKSGPLMPWAAKMVVEYIAARVKYCIYEQHDLECGVVFEGVDSREDFDKFLLDAKKNYRNISETALDIGTLAHNWLEEYTKTLIAGIAYNAPLPANDKAIFCIEAALKWQKAHNFRPIAAEKKVYSKKYNTAGTFDWIAVIDSCDDTDCCKRKFTNMRVLGDYKSSKAIYDEYRIQTAFYHFAVEEEDPKMVLDGRVLLRLGKEDGEFESLILTDFDAFDADLSAFEGALAIYTWMQQIKLNEKAEKQKLRELKPKKETKRRIKIPQAESIPVVG